MTTQSGTGVGFTRDASTGENTPYGDFLVNAQGEDVVAGIRNTEDLDALQRTFPKIHAELLKIFARLERHYRDMCDTEFTIEQGKLWMLQTRVGKRTGAAALRMAVEMTTQKGWKITQAEALQRVEADHLDQVLHPQFEGGAKQVIAKGLGASPGAAVGRVYFTADDAVDASERGEAVVLVRNETSPGGRARHAGGGGDPHRSRRPGEPRRRRRPGLGHPGRGGRRRGEDRRPPLHRRRPSTVAEGDVISLDGTTGEVVLGAMALADAEPPAEFATILAWADRVRKGKLAVRANADTGARRHGGPRLRRRGHRPLPHGAHVPRRGPAPDRAGHDPRRHRRRRRRPPSSSCGSAQKADFLEILEAMDGLPVTVRLLDPPLHEFLPSVEELLVQQATTGLDAEETALLAAAESWREQNPMLGTRGVRLGVLKPGLYAMQVRALDGGRRRAARGRPAPGRGDHDPPHRHPGGDAARPGLGRGGDRRRRPAPTPRAWPSRSAR